MKKLVLTAVVGLTVLASATQVSASTKITKVSERNYKGLYNKVCEYRAKGVVVDEDGKKYKVDLPLKRGTIFEAEFWGEGTQNREDDRIISISYTL